ncbi:MAG: zinc ribbon domain-containing protein, partial [Proteobacteria bacterium]
MPFYEYQCRACGAQTEVLQKISDAPLRKCPDCGKNQLQKLVSAPVFRLKGAGWYETDFKSDADRKRNLVGDKDEAPAAKPAEGEKTAAEGTKEAKPEAAEKPAAVEKPAAKAKPASTRKPSKPAAKKR